MKICTRIFLHKLLIVGEQIKIGLCHPLLEGFVEFSRVPSRKRYIFEQWRFQKIEFCFADHLQKHLTLDNCTLRLKVDGNNVFFKRQLHLKMEIYCQEAATNRMLNCSLTEKKIVKVVWSHIEVCSREVVSTCLWIYDPYRGFASDIALISFGRSMIKPHHDVMWVWED